MMIKICGHRIDWQKPIKNYNIFKIVLCAVFLAIAAPATTYAADDVPAKGLAIIAPSSGTVTGCDYPLKKNAQNSTSAGQHNAPTMSPAYALALVLGVRNIAGPMERSPAAPKKSFATSSTSFDRRTPLLPQGKGNTPVIPTHVRLPRPGWSD